MACVTKLRWLGRLAVIATVLAVTAVLAPAAPAADALQEGTALKMVPAEVGFYTSALRTGEQFTAFINSKAFAQLKSMPIVQMGTFMASAQWQNPQNPQVAQIKAMLQQEVNQQLVAMLQDAVSQEIFVCGDAGVGELVSLASQLNTASNAGQIEAMSAGDLGQAPQYQLKNVLTVLAQREDLRIPVTLLGFKLTDVARAQAQLQRLEQLITMVGAQQPILQQRFAKEKVGDGEYLTLRLDGSLVPWQQLPLDPNAENADQIKTLIEKLKKMTLVISLGVRGDYLLLSMGSDNALLSKLGQAPLLYDAPELAALRAQAAQPITGISYASADLMKSVGSVDGQMDQLTAMVAQLLPMAPLSGDLQDEVLADVNKLADYVKASAPTPGAVMGFSFRTPGGYESFTYNWAKNSQMDASQPLSVLEHVGGDPLAFYAARGKTSPEDMDVLGEVVSRLGYYAEQIMLQQADEAQQKAWETLKKDMMPLMARAGAVTRDKLAPAMADGQGALVLDAKSTSKQWHLALPEAEKPLPMFELALVEGVTDAGKLKEAFGEYFTILQEMLNKLHTASTGELKEFFPEEIPQIDLQPPQSRAVGEGTVYYYALPLTTGLDAQVAPNAGLSANTLVVSLLPQFSERLLKTTPLQGSGPLNDVARPLGSALHLNFAGLIEALEPWIDYGMGLSMQTSVNTQPGAMGGVIQQVVDVLDVLKCIRSVSAVTYQEGDTTVTHALWKIEDLQ